MKQLTRIVEPCDVNVYVRLKNIKPLHANWPIQAYHYLKILFFGVQESSHNWSFKGSAFPNQSWRKPFWRNANFVMIDYNMKGKYNLSQHSDMSFTPNGRGVFYIYLMLRQGSFLFFHQTITLQKLRKMLFHLKSSFSYEDI